jgi:hypothetical protein
MPCIPRIAAGVPSTPHIAVDIVPFARFFEFGTWAL